MINFGAVPVGAVLPIFFDSFAGSTGASITLTGLAATDIEVYKGTSMTQRSSDAGFTLLDTDGIDLDGVTGIHGFSIDTGDNTDASFYAAGSFYTVVVSAVTIDSQTVNFVAATFRLVAAETTAGVPQSRASAIADGAIAAATIADGAIDLATFAADAKALFGVIAFGTAQSVTGTTIQLASAETFADDELIGATVLIRSATTGAGQSRVITGYVSATDTATVDTWTTTPTGTITYVVFGTAPASTSAPLAVNVTQFGGVAGTFASGIPEVKVASIANNAITATSIASDAITAATFAAGAINAAAIATGAIDADALAADAVAEIADGVWDEATAGHTTAGSTGKALTDASSAGDPWSTAVPGAYAAGTAGYLIGTNLDATVSSRLATSGYTAPLSAAGTRTALGLASANLDTQLGDIPTATENADALLARNVAGGSDGTRTVSQALYVLRNKVAISAGTLTVYGTDDSTPAFTASVTTAAGDPVSAIDPA